MHIPELCDEERESGLKRLRGEIETRLGLLLQSNRGDILANASDFLLEVVASEPHLSNLSARAINDNSLRISTDNRPLARITIDQQKASNQLRSICARISQCAREAGTENNPYGGENVEWNTTNRYGDAVRVRLTFQNTPEEQRLHLTRIS